MTPFDSPALRDQSPFYPLEWWDRVPRRVLMDRTVRSLPPGFRWVGIVNSQVAIAGTLFDVWVDQNGYCMVIFETGEMLSVKRSEIIVVEWHDPSGIDMTRDISERLDLFTRGRFEIQVHRVALNYEQVEQWQPPENPAKETDSRYETYRNEFGDSSWELDAVEPATMAGLVRDQIEELIDWAVWAEVEKKETGMRKELERYATRYEKRKKK